MVFSTLLKLSKRVPLIKFRKGGLLPAAAGAQNVASSAPSKSSKKAHAPAIEDWELHPRYWRKELEPAEIDYINNGGPC